MRGAFLALRPASTEPSSRLSCCSSWGPTSFGPATPRSCVTAVARSDGFRGASVQVPRSSPDLDAAAWRRCAFALPAPPASADRLGFAGCPGGPTPAASLCPRALARPAEAAPSNAARRCSAHRWSRQRGRHPKARQSTLPPHQVRTGVAPTLQTGRAGSFGSASDRACLEGPRRRPVHAELVARGCRARPNPRQCEVVIVDKVA